MVREIRWLRLVRRSRHADRLAAVGMLRQDGDSRAVATGDGRSRACVGTTRGCGEGIAQWHYSV